MNSPRLRFALLLLAASFSMSGCQKYAELAVRRGLDPTVPVVIPAAESGIRGQAPARWNRRR